MQNRLGSVISRQQDRNDAGLDSNRPQTSTSTTNRPISQASTRPESRILEQLKIPNVRLVATTTPPLPVPTEQLNEVDETVPETSESQKHRATEEAAVEDMEIEESRSNGTLTAVSVTNGNDAICLLRHHLSF
ncbi:unnamed protein product [Caenorhabditis angaria]|uniref:Uncharacterized protein n=1 Tax=Caenorhabditis angaria TaxID=860376 RepID=A0A9P1II15_9PELO|nr:unnamed protein product [Caenorhabditis angaria]